MESMKLEKGRVYRGRLVVTTGMFVTIEDDDVIPPLEKVGFQDIKVWWNEDDLPDDWPEDRKLDVSDFEETCVWLEGRWEGKDGQVAPDGGEHWKAFDMWPKGESKGGVVYGKRKTATGKAITVAGWSLGLFLFGLPIVLAMNSGKDKAGRR